MTTTDDDTQARAQFERDLEELRVDLRSYCYRMLGSPFDAEDAVQDTLVRAWRYVDRFEGRSSLRSWLYRIATNVCLDIISRRQRRALPTDLSAPGRPGTGPGEPTSEYEWVEPAGDGWLHLSAPDPAEHAVLRDSVRLAFVAALQLLPPRQRAALLLREVLAWKPNEIAELLDTTVVSVNSALQRARQTLASVDTGREFATVDAVSQDLLERYVDAMERSDIDALVALLHEDATWQMPPFRLWLQGRDDIGAWLADSHCGGSRHVPLALNGAPGFTLYRDADGSGVEKAFAVQLLEIRDDRIVAVHSFLDERLPALFGASATIDL